MDAVRSYGEESHHVVSRHIDKKMALARPMFQLGFKDTDFDTEYVVKVVTTKILLDMLFGESSEFFERLYSKGLVDGPFALEYTAGSFYGTAVCSNSADCPGEVAESVLCEINQRRADGLDDKRFAQIKRKHLGRFIRSLNSIESVSHGQMELAFRGLDIFDILKAYQNVAFSQVGNRFRRLFREDNYATSVIMPDR
jgi:predicted Zn-dependent peptidase